MVESKYVVYGLVSGAVSGIVAGVVVYLGREGLMKLIDELISLEGNVPPETFSYVKSIVSYILMFSPILYLIQMVVIGAIFGSLEDYFIKKFGLKPVLAALASGGVFLIFFLIFPFMTLLAVDSKLVSLIIKHLGLARILLPSAVYVATLTFLSATDILEKYVREEEVLEGEEELNVEATSYRLSVLRFWAKRKLNLLE